MRDTVVGRLAASQITTTVVNYRVVVAVDAFSLSPVQVISDRRDFS